MNAAPELVTVIYEGHQCSRCKVRLHSGDQVEVRKQGFAILFLCEECR